MLIPAAAGPLLLLAVASGYGQGDEPRFELTRSLTMSYDAWVHPVSTVFFCVGVVLPSRRRGPEPPAAPVAAGPASSAGLGPGRRGAVPGRRPAGHGQPLEITSTAHTLLILPLALYEMAFALWLLIKGFNPASAPALATADRAA